MMLAHAIAVGLAAVALTAVLRWAPGLRGLTERGVKPLSCDTCMSLWTALVCAGLSQLCETAPRGAEGLLAGAAAVGVALLGTRAVGAPPPLASPPPGLDDDDATPW